MTLSNTKFKKYLILSILIGLIIACLTRASILVVTTDFQFIEVLGKYNYPNLVPHDQTHYGKNVIGLGGFPFSTFSECSMGHHGEFVTPACKEYSTLGEYALVLNTLVWGGLIFGILALFKRKKS